MSASLCIRQAAETDARDLLAIYRPFEGFMNDPLVQLPCVDYVPRHLLTP